MDCSLPALEAMNIVNRKIKEHLVNKKIKLGIDSDLNIQYYTKLWYCNIFEFILSEEKDKFIKCKSLRASKEKWKKEEKGKSQKKQGKEKAKK